MTEQQDTHLVVSQKAGVTKVACGSKNFILATHLAANVTCDDCIAYMARRDHEQHGGK